MNVEVVLSNGAFSEHTALFETLTGSIHCILTYKLAYGTLTNIYKILVCSILETVVFLSSYVHAFMLPFSVNN